MKAKLGEPTALGNKVREMMDEPPSTIRYPRDNNLDIEFLGWVIGIGDHGYGPVKAFNPKVHLNGVRVEIAITAGSGALIAYVKRYSEDGEEHAAESFRIPKALIDWLKRDSGGKLGPASKAAWAQACEFKMLKGMDVEVIK